MKSNLICKRYYSFGLHGSDIETENPSRLQKISQISISSAEDITVLSSGEVYDIEAENPYTYIVLIENFPIHMKFNAQSEADYKR